jgi:hypothetical protein
MRQTSLVLNSISTFARIATLAFSFSLVSKTCQTSISAIFNQLQSSPLLFHPFLKLSSRSILQLFYFASPSQCTPYLQFASPSKLPMYLHPVEIQVIPSSNRRRLQPHTLPHRDRRQRTLRLRVHRKEGRYEPARLVG